MDKYISQYSYTYHKYFVAKEQDGKIELIWPCKNEAKSIKFANALNSGSVVMCKGCKEFNSACGNCIKCECTD